MPYLVIIEALSALVRHILTKSNEKIVFWKERITIALEVGGNAILDEIPELKNILGSENIVYNSPDESKSNFGYSLQRLIHAFATTTNPLAFLIDDPQWVDIPTAKLLESFFPKYDSKNVLVVVAYNKEYVKTSYLLKTIINDIDEKYNQILKLQIKQLKECEITSLLNDSLNFNQDSTKQLAKICYNKTAGNPYFFKQFLQRIFDEKLISNDNYLESGTINFEKVIAQSITDNVIANNYRKI